MNKHKSQLGILHTFREGEDELHTNPVSKEQSLIECEKQLVRQQQILKIMALSFHKFLESHTEIFFKIVNQKTDVAIFNRIYGR